MKRFLILLGLSSNLAFGQNISTEAPSVSASAITVPKSGIQLESSLGVFANFSDINNRSYIFNAPALLLRYGFTDRIEVRAAGTYSIFQSATGVQSYRVTGVDVGAKFEFLNKPEGKTQIALIAHANLYNQGSPFYGGALTLAVNHTIASNHSIGFNLGYSYSMQQIPGLYERISRPNSSLIYNFQWTPQITVFGEAFWSASNLVTKQYNVVTKHAFQSTYGFDLGLLYLIKSNIQLDAAIGLNHTFDTFFGQVGFNILLDNK